MSVLCQKTRCNSPQIKSNCGKLKDLYAQFQNIKSRMGSCNKKYQKLDGSTVQKVQLKTERKIQKSVNRSFLLHDHMMIDQFCPSSRPHNNPSNEPTNMTMLAFQEILKNSIDHFVQFQVMNFHKTVSEQMEKIERKICKSSTAIIKIKDNLKVKCQANDKMTKFRRKISGSSQESTASLILFYQQKIGKIIQSYQKRLKGCDEDKDKQTFSSTVKIIEKEGGNNFYEKEIIAKEKEMRKVKLEFYNLKKSHDILKNQYEIIVQNQSSKQKQIQNLQQEILRLKSLTQGKQSVQSFQEDTNQIYAPIQIQNNSIYKDQQIGNEHQQIQFDCESMRDFDCAKSLILSPKRKNSVGNSLKKLEVEVDLISEENKHLKYKKDCLQSQLQSSEIDEQRFQQQNLLLKGQIKYLTTTLNCLDEISLQYLRTGSFQLSKIQQLPQQIKSKKAFLQLSQKKGRK